MCALNVVAYKSARSICTVQSVDLVNLDNPRDTLGATLVSFVAEAYYQPEYRSSWDRDVTHTMMRLERPPRELAPEDDPRINASWWMPILGPEYRDLPSPQNDGAL